MREIKNLGHLQCHYVSYSVKEDWMRALFAFVFLMCPSLIFADTCKDLMDQFTVIVNQQKPVADAIVDLARTPTAENEVKICMLIDTLVPLREKQEVVIKSVVQRMCASPREVSKMKSLHALAGRMYCTDGHIRHKDDPFFVFVHRK